MTTSESPAGPPDWSSLAFELECPLCNYNLRGLIDSRCPECGFSFEWAELLDRKRDRHPYLFEHQERHNIWSFWKTFWRDCRPWRFWREVRPTNPVRVGRLLLFWFLANSVLLGMFLAMLLSSAWRIYQQNAAYRQIYVPVPGTPLFALKPALASQWPSNTPITASQLDLYAPLPNHWRFWRSVWGSGDRFGPSVEAGATALVWPWLTLISMLIFQQSLGRAKLKKAHLLRLAIYGCDFSLLMVIAIASLTFAWRWDDDQPLVIALLCAAVALLRLTFGYSRYLRFNLPFFTALATQAVVLLAVYVTELNLGWISVGPRS